MVRYFFTTGEVSDRISEAHICLILKKSKSESMRDLRSIELCNVSYKILSKFVDNRLKLVLPHIISETQSAFVPNHFMTDNIMISFEIMHYLKRKTVGKDGYMAIKLDMSKTYDRIGWDFS